jgi:hypothetical protein
MIPTLKSLASLLVLTAISILPVSSNRQPAQTVTTATPPTTFTGCVQRSANDNTVLIVSGKDFCVKLTGTFSGDKLAGHQATVRGTMVAGSTTQPAAIQVTSVTSIGAACSDACSLAPPGGRGLKKKGELPGREGGTPGMSGTPPQQPQ